MIGVLSFIACLVVWYFGVVMTYEFEQNKKQHNKTSWVLFIVSMVIFAIVSYL